MPSLTCMNAHLSMLFSRSPASCSPSGAMLSTTISSGSAVHPSVVWLYPKHARRRLIQKTSPAGNDLPVSWMFSSTFFSFSIHISRLLINQNDVPVFPSDDHRNASAFHMRPLAGSIPWKGASRLSRFSLLKAWDTRQKLNPQERVSNGGSAVMAHWAWRRRYPPIFAPIEAKTVVNVSLITLEACDLKKTSE